MIGNLGAVDNTPDLRRKPHALRKGQHRQKRRNKVSRRLLHILGKKIAVCSRIGQQALFI